MWSSISCSRSSSILEIQSKTSVMKYASYPRRFQVTTKDNLAAKLWSMIAAYQSSYHYSRNHITIYKYSLKLSWNLMFGLDMERRLFTHSFTESRMNFSRKEQFVEVAAYIQVFLAQNMFLGAPPKLQHMHLHLTPVSIKIFKLLNGKYVQEYVDSCNVPSYIWIVVARDVKQF